MQSYAQTPRRLGRRRFAAALAILLSGAATYFTVTEQPAHAQSAVQELQSVQGQLGGLRAELDAQNREVDGLIAQLAPLKARETEAEEILAAKQSELEVATAELRAEQKELEKVEARLDRAVAELEDLLVSIYKSGRPDVLTVVLDSANWSEVIADAEYMEQIQEHDQAIVDRVDALQAEIAEHVERLNAAQERIKAARDEISKQRDVLREAQQPLEARRAALEAARDAQQANINELLSREKALLGDLFGGSTPAGAKAKLVNGEAIAPPNAPAAVKGAIAAANRINHKPYVWGGGHGSFESSGYDCSGAVSYALHGGGLLSSPMASGGFMGYGAPGTGKWITIYANSGHVYAVIAGLRWDTSMTGGNGPRWSAIMRSPAGFVARHPVGF